MSLYEIEYHRKLEGDTAWSESRKHQIPATSESNALVQLGQIFHREDLEIHVAAVKKVAA